MRIFLKNNRAKFYPDKIFNDGVLGFLKSFFQQEQEEEEQQQDA